MNNYFEEIENAYVRIRGTHILLNPLDWALAQSWENKGIPLHIVLSAMADVQKRFNAQKRPDKINSLSYFTQAVEKSFIEYSKSQIGKSQPDDTAETNVEMDGFVCKTCKFYRQKNESDKFYDGWCINDAIHEKHLKISDFEVDPDHYSDIIISREICNAEIELELPENYEFYESKNKDWIERF